MKEIETYLFNATVGKIVVAMIGIIIIFIISKIAKGKLSNQFEDNSSRHKTKKLIDFVGFILMIVMLSVVYSDKLGGLTVAFGVAGAGIAFALQEVIASVAGWLAIMFGGFYKTGDRVKLGGIKGDVIDIGVLRTTIMETGEWVDGDLYNGRLVLIANSFVFKEPVFNYSGDFPYLWDEIKIPIMFGSNYKKAESIMTEIANEVVKEYSQEAQNKWKGLVSKYMIEDAQTTPMITLVVNDNWVEYTVRYTVHYKKRRGTKNELYTQILQAVEATGTEVKFASATFHLVEAPEIKVSFSK
ncbi:MULTISPECIES: mechanosensitive ion channel family protein [unclassified Flavobacterium]|uniref:mechanosensitive ion channel family protein n=1 Tax=unclassified Flavobacterium TaxID=196869 RepID=UPI00131ECF61|nr:MULTISPECIES: mechanosensitive ion channel family protein [unclassified Flavobacterium]